MGINRHYESAPTPAQEVAGEHSPAYHWTPRTWGSQNRPSMSWPRQPAIFSALSMHPPLLREQGFGIYLLGGHLGQMFSSDNSAEELAEEIFSQLCLVSFWTKVVLRYAAGRKVNRAAVMWILAEIKKTYESGLYKKKGYGFRFSSLPASGLSYSRTVCVCITHPLPLGCTRHRLSLALVQDKLAVFWTLVSSGGVIYYSFHSGRCLDFIGLSQGPMFKDLLFWVGIILQSQLCSKFSHFPWKPGTKGGDGGIQHI